MCILANSKQTHTMFMVSSTKQAWAVFTETVSILSLKLSQPQLNNNKATNKRKHHIFLIFFTKQQQKQHKQQYLINYRPNFDQTLKVNQQQYFAITDLK